LIDFAADGDGELSEEERAAAVAARRAEILAAFDADGDGELNEEELAAAREARQAEREARHAERLAEMDTDGDGEVSEEERDAFHAARLAEIDTDGDGEISPEEHEAARTARCESGETDEAEDEEDAIVDELVLSVGFIRGEANGDGAMDITDAVFVLSYLFLGGTQPSCMDAADSNDDGTVDIADPTAILSTLFLGGSPLPPPTVERGVDPTIDALSCGRIAGS